MSQYQSNRERVSIFDGALTIEDRPGQATPWCLVDTHTGAEIPVAPEEVPPLIVLFRSFRRSMSSENHPRSVTPTHTCSENYMNHDVVGLDDGVNECTICGEMKTPEAQ